MIGKTEREYTNKCGSCKYFSFHVKDGDTREHGKCHNVKRKPYHQASQKACKLYQTEG